MSTDAKRAGNARYQATLDRIVIRIHKDGTDGFTKEQLENTAKQSGTSVNQWLIDLINGNI